MYSQNDKEMQMASGPNDGSSSATVLNGNYGTPISPTGIQLAQANVFWFEGNSITLQARLSSMQPSEVDKFIDTQINVTGVKVKASNHCCIGCTLGWGFILIFPFCFFCCGWWENIAHEQFQVDASVYQSICDFIRRSNIRILNLKVKDNFFNAQKADILYNGLSQSRITGFAFTNMAGSYNTRGREWSDFEQNMAKFKGLTNIMSEIKWDSKLIS